MLLKAAVVAWGATGAGAARGAATKAVKSAPSVCVCVHVYVSESEELTSIGLLLQGKEV